MYSPLKRVAKSKYDQKLASVPVKVDFPACQDNLSLENCNTCYFAIVQTPGFTSKDSLLYVGGGGCMESLLGAIWSWNWAIYMHWSPPHLTNRALKYSRFLTFFFFRIEVDLYQLISVLNLDFDSICICRLTSFN